MASAVARKVAELVAQLPADFFKPLVAPGTLDAAQVEDLNEVAEALQTEYTVRRRMLLERLKVTLQVGWACVWGDLVLLVTAQQGIWSRCRCA
eukprot:scaffold323358_cov18-Tisochrysis_lutea.AAC.1